jgi:hypothetical protein
LTIPQRRTEDHAQPVFDTTPHIIGQLRTIGIDEHGHRRAATMRLDQQFHS